MNKTTIYVGKQIGNDKQWEGNTFTTDEIGRFFDAALYKKDLQHLGYTITDGQGCWKGQKEPSVKIELLHNADLHDDLLIAANWLKKLTRQKELLIEVEQAYVLTV